MCILAMLKPNRKMNQICEKLYIKNFLASFLREERQSIYTYFYNSVTSPTVS